MLKLLIAHLQNYGIRKKKILYLLGVVILFWALFDGIISYIVPIVITEAGVSKTLMGIIIGTSSIAGALFDFIACKLFRSTYYKRLFMLMFAICFGFPLLLFKAHSFLLFVIAMALWGIYYDLRMIGTFNYVGRFSAREEHSQDFGVVQVFAAMGYLLAPLIVGFLIADSLNWQPFVLAWIFLAISILFFIILISQTRSEAAQEASRDLSTSPLPHRSIWSEAVLWSRLGRILFPALLLTFFLNFADAFFWTIGPLVAQGLSGLEEFGGVFMTIYALPPLLVGWVVGSFTGKFGKKHTAFASLFIGSLFLTLFNFIGNSFALILDVFCLSFFLSLAYPAINGAYADYISETDDYEQEIEGLEDFYTNVGYVLGPMLAGYLADQLGTGGTFSVLGVLGLCTASFLWWITPKSIDVRAQLDTTGTS